MVDHDAVGEAILAIDGWLDTMRCPGGYGGPVVHWWRDSLAYAGPGLDWRYEGIITGYLNLHRHTGHGAWLAKARRAGDDLVQGQLSSGTYRNSSFEINPLSGGTPHEAACDLALLRLSRVLRDHEEPAWQTYAAAAQRNLESFVVGVLWNGAARRLRNTAYDESFVPNKAATAAEALIAWAELSGNDAWINAIALPILENVLAAQVQEAGSPVRGAIAQSTGAGEANQRYFPYYIARCVPALVQGYQKTGEVRYMRAAKEAMAFIVRVRLKDGSFPQVVYRDGRRVNCYPQWIAALGDVLRAMELMREHGMAIDTEPTLSWLLEGRQHSVGLRTARGFGFQVSQAHSAPLPDFRDLLGVCGWVDKAFHYLTGHPATAGISGPTKKTVRLSIPCRYAGRPAMFREDRSSITIQRGQRLLYRWTKGASWAEMEPN